MSAAAERKPIIDLAEQAWAIHNIIQTLHVAVPDDPIGSEVPTRCLLSHVLSLTEPLALELMALESNARKGGKQ